MQFIVIAARIYIAHEWKSSILSYSTVIQCINNIMIYEKMNTIFSDTRDNLTRCRHPGLQPCMLLTSIIIFHCNLPDRFSFFGLFLDSEDVLLTTVLARTTSKSGPIIYGYIHNLLWYFIAQPLLILVLISCILCRHVCLSYMLLASFWSLAYVMHVFIRKYLWN